MSMMKENTEASWLKSFPTPTVNPMNSQLLMATPEHTLQGQLYWYTANHTGCTWVWAKISPCCSNGQFYRLCSGALQNDHLLHRCIWLMSWVMSRYADGNVEMMLHWNQPDVTDADDDVECKSLGVISNNLQGDRDCDALMMTMICWWVMWWAAIKPDIGRHCHSLGFFTTTL